MMADKRRNSDNGSQTAGFNGIETAKLLDDINIKIVKELIVNPSTSSSEISEKLQVPLSTIQRRRARLEQTILKIGYTLDIRAMGWRTADLLIAVEKGKTEQTAQDILKYHKNNVMAASVRIGDPKVDIMAEVIYKNSGELYKLIESVKSMPYVTYVEWAEIVKEIGNNTLTAIDTILRHSQYNRSSS
jgi:DNA-binding Lrp family transcriptional regulator